MERWGSRLFIYWHKVREWFSDPPIWRKQLWPQSWPLVHWFEGPDCGLDHHITQLWSPTTTCCLAQHQLWILQWPSISYWYSTTNALWTDSLIPVTFFKLSPIHCLTLCGLLCNFVSFDCPFHILSIRKHVPLFAILAQKSYCLTSQGVLNLRAWLPSRKNLLRHCRVHV